MAKWDHIPFWKRASFQQMFYDYVSCFSWQHPMLISDMYSELMEAAFHRSNHMKNVTKIRQIVTKRPLQLKMHRHF